MAWAVGEPPTLVFLAFEPWSGSQGLRVAESPAASIPTPGELLLDVGISVDTVRSRVAAAGLTVTAEPVDQSWGRREMAFLLPEGHLIRVSGPTSPRG